MAQIISIEGNIGSGKSTLVTYLKNTLDKDKYVFVDEPVNTWQSIRDNEGVDIISKFYEDQEKYAFPFQMLAYISRISAIKKVINNGKIVITERCVNTDKEVFAKMLYDDNLIEDINYKIYNMWFDEFNKDIKVDKFVYLQTDPALCSQRIKQRNRQGEEINLDYLYKCHDYHENWISNIPNKIILDGKIHTQDLPIHEIIKL
jgi:deoxyadenosine/deoxycytidine kinase